MDAPALPRVVFEHLTGWRLAAWLALEWLRVGCPVIAMGKFNSAFRYASDPALPLPVRYLKFIETCSAFGRIARSHLQAVYDALGGLFSFSREGKPDAAQISHALAAMVQVRFRLLNLLSDARIQKRKRKAAGDRRKQPHPFTVEDVLRWLDAARQLPVSNRSR